MRKRKIEHVVGRGHQHPMMRLMEEVDRVEREHRASGIAIDRAEGIGRLTVLGTIPVMLRVREMKTNSGFTRAAEMIAENQTGITLVRKYAGDLLAIMPQEVYLAIMQLLDWVENKELRRLYRRKMGLGEQDNDKGVSLGERK